MKQPAPLCVDRCRSHRFAPLALGMTMLGVGCAGSPARPTGRETPPVDREIASVDKEAGATTRESPAIDTGPLDDSCAELSRLSVAELGVDISKPVASKLRIDQVRELFHRAEAFGLSGGFLIGRAGEIVAIETCGLASRERREPMRTDAVFDTGSVSKQFTAAAVLALEDAGLLSTDDPISRFFPDVPEDKQSITVDRLLTHTAGIPHDVEGPEILPERDEAVRQILQAKLLFAPGAGQSYSNAGYALLAAIVEIASGEDFETCMRERLWLPLGITRTGMTLQGRSGSQIAEGITFPGPVEGWWPEFWGPDGPSWRIRGCGYVSSTMEELYRWIEALRTGRVLSHAAREKLFRPHAREPNAKVSYYGYGWEITSAPGGACVVTHNGSAGIHYDVVAILPQDDVVLVTFCTQQATPWRNFPERVLGVLTGADEIDLPPVGSATAEELASLAGEYALPAGERLAVEVIDGRLTIPVTNAAVLRLFDPWPPAEPAEIAELGDRASLVSSVIDGIAREDFAPLAEHLRADVKLEDEKDFWGEYWSRWIEKLGAYQGTDVVETVRVGGSLRTLALIRFARSSTVVGFIHQGEGKAYVDVMLRDFLRDIPLAPQADGGFLAFHPKTRRSIRVAFGGPPEEREIAIGDGPEQVVARRVRDAR